MRTKLENLAANSFQIHLVEQWIVLTSNKFDLKIPKWPPFQSLSVLYNCQSQEFVCRTFARCLEQGSFETVEQLAQYARDTFEHKSACIGNGDFPFSSVFSEGCAKYVPKNISCVTGHFTDGQEIRIENRCDSCRTHFDGGECMTVPKLEPTYLDTDIPDTFIVVKEGLDPPPDNNHSEEKDENSESLPTFEVDTLKTEVDLDPLPEVSSMDMNDGLEPSVLIFAKNKIDVQSTQVMNASDSSAPKALPSLPQPSSSSVKKPIVVFPTNTNQGPRADGKYECEYCGHVLTSRDGIMEHKKVNHGWGHFQCHMCPSVYKASLDFIRHIMETHVGVSEARCPQCRHLVHFEGDEQVFEGHYSVCLRSHRSAQTARQREREKESEPAQHPCDICGRIYGSLLRLKRHQRIHKQKRFACKECGYLAHRRKGLLDHMEMHERERGTAKEHVCPHCAHVCLGSSHLKRHIDRHHRTYECSDCPEICLGITLLKKHMAQVHGANKCDICAMCFATKPGLQRHMVTHFEPSLSCQYCPSKFKTNRSKIRHERTLHTGEGSVPSKKHSS